MRIGLFSDTYAPDINGVATSVATLRAALVSQGHEVYVFTVKGIGVKYTDDKNIIRIDGIKLKKLYNYVLTGPVHLILEEKIKALKLDVIHVHTEFGIGLFARLVSHRLHIPIVYTYHTFYEDYTHYVNFVHNDSVDHIAKEVVIFISRLLGDKCTQMICPTLKTQKRLIEYGITTNINVIPTGLDLSYLDTDFCYRKPFSEDTLMLLFVGRLAKEKNIEILIEAIDLLKKENNNVGLLIVGDGPDYIKLQQSVIDRNLEENVKFTGRVDHHNLGAYYKECDGFVSASLSETQGLTFIEALAAGKPILGMDRNALEEVLKEAETGYYFDDLNELIEKIKLLKLRNDETKEEMRKAALKMAERYSLDNFGKAAQEVYMKAIEEYHDCNIITKIRIKDETCKISVTKDDVEATFVISVDDYLENGYHVRDSLSQTQMDALANMHAYNFAYNKIMRKLKSHDMSEKEINDFLKTQKNISATQKEKLLDLLKQVGYVDDETLAITQLYVDEIKKVGKKKTALSLKKRGIDSETINKVLKEVDRDEENERCYKKAQLLAKTIKGRSYRETLNKIHEKLVVEGFDSLAIDYAMNSLELNYDKDTEKTNLLQAYQKALRNYSRKLEGKKLYDNIYRYLVSKGYRYEDINEVVGNKEDES